jgi:hypothetical protein
VGFENYTLATHANATFFLTISMPSKIHENANSSRKSPANHQPKQTTQHGHQSQDTDCHAQLNLTSGSLLKNEFDSKPIDVANFPVGNM